MSAPADGKAKHHTIGGERMRSEFPRQETQRKRRRVSLPVLCVTALLALLLGCFLTLLLLMGRIGQNGLSVIQAMGVVRSGFVGDYDWDEVTDQTLSALVEALDDQWSYYLTAEEHERVLAMRSNSYVGIGVTVSRQYTDVLYILSVEQGSPAEEAGILPEEAVVAVEGQRVTEDNWGEMMTALSGAAGTEVTITLRDAEETERTVTLIRRAIHANPVKYESLSLADGRQVGLISLKNFYTGSGEDFIYAARALEEDGAQAFVIDLRNNPGGYVTEMRKILDYLLPEGAIFQSESLGGKKKVYRSDADCVELPCVLLVNGGSYSAAEFFAAQMRESVQSRIVGEATSGKGYAQQLFGLRNGSAVGLSTSRYRTGAGVSLAGEGVTPDLTVSLDEEAYRAFVRGELSHEEDPQLQAALASLLAAE